LLYERKDIPPFEAIILGSDQGRNVYKKRLLGLVQQYRLNKIIKFIDRCEEMPVAYRIANLVCSCSIEPEAFGRVAVESQSMQIPIIASDIEDISKNEEISIYHHGKWHDLCKGPHLPSTGRIGKAFKLF